MPVVPFNHNLIKIGKREYRNPIYLAQEWRKALDHGEYTSPAALARDLNISRARVTQLLNLLKLAPEAIEIVSSLGDPLRKPVITERSLRQLLEIAPEKQVEQLKIILIPTLKLTSPTAKFKSPQVGLGGQFPVGRTWQHDYNCGVVMK